MHKTYIYFIFKKNLKSVVNVGPYKLQFILFVCKECKLINIIFVIYRIKLPQVKCKAFHT